MSEALLCRLAANVLAVASRSRETVQAGPFRAFLSPVSDDYLLNVAVPTAPAADWPAAIGELRAVFERRGRLLRLEFFAELYPDLAPALTAAGLLRNHAAPVMALRPGELLAPPPPAGTRYVRLGAGDGRLIDQFLDMQRAAFRELAEIDMTGWRSMLTAGLADGSLRVAALLAEDRVAAGASLMLGAGLAELAGVGTHPDRRRRGYAGFLCGRLLAEYLAERDAFCWLSAGEGAQGLYRRLGFKPVGTQLHYGLKAV